MPRPKGSRNRVTQSNIDLAAQFKTAPLQYMLEVLNDETQDEDGKPLVSPELRFEAAKAAAPYVHPKLMAARLEVMSHDPDQEPGAPALPRVSEILGELTASIIEGESEEVVPNGSVLPAPVHAGEEGS